MKAFVALKPFAIFVLILAAVGPLPLRAQTTQDKDADKKNPPVAKTPKKDQKKPEQKEEPNKEEKKGGMTPDTFAGLKFRLIGPAVASGRVVSIAVNPKNKKEYYVGVASGGVWKTVNDGTTWTPVFDGEGSYSIGWVTLDPNDPSVVWAGSGESNSQRSVSYGDGIYRSEDGGKSWQNLGLSQSTLGAWLSIRGIRRLCTWRRKGRFGDRAVIAGSTRARTAERIGSRC
jgi:hypothetical protein